MDMKVRDLNNLFGLDMNEVQLNKTLTSVSHWMRTLRKTEEFEAAEEKDKKALEKLALLKLATLKNREGEIVKAKITEDGKELYLDFFKLGYYGKQGI